MSPKHPLVGQHAPEISLPNADGTAYELKPGCEGKPMAVFFYPQAGAFFPADVRIHPVLAFGNLGHGQTPMVAREKSALFGMRSMVRHFVGLTFHEREWRTNKIVGGWVHLEKVEFKDSGITVVGIAPNSVAAVKAFATKHNVTVCKPRPSSAPLRSLRFLTLTRNDSTRC